MNVGNGTGAVTVDGVTGVPDAFVVSPLTATSAAIQDNGLNPVVNATTSGLLTIDPLGGGDSVTVNGTAANDTITAAPSGLNTVVTVNALEPINIVTADTANLIVEGNTGNDNLTVNSSAGPVTIPITYDGGPGTNALTLLGGTATADVYTPGSQLGSGTDTLTFPTGTELIHFMNLSPVFDSVASPLTVNGTNAANEINYAEGYSSPGTLSTTWGQVSVDSYEPIDFTNKTSLTIYGLAGGDTINLNNPYTPTDLAGITVYGDDDTVGDTLIANGTAAADTINFAPTRG